MTFPKQEARTLLPPAGQKKTEIKNTFDTIYRKISQNWNPVTETEKLATSAHNKYLSQLSVGSLGQVIWYQQVRRQEVNDLQAREDHWELIDEDDGLEWDQTQSSH